MVSQDGSALLELPIGALLLLTALSIKRRRAKEMSDGLNAPGASSVGIASLRLDQKLSPGPFKTDSTLLSPRLDDVANAENTNRVHQRLVTC